MAKGPGKIALQKDVQMANKQHENLVNNISHAAAAAKSLHSCQILYHLWTVVCWASLSMGFSRQEYWSGLPFPSPVQESEK